MTVLQGDRVESSGIRQVQSPAATASGYQRPELTVELRRLEALILAGCCPAPCPGAPALLISAGARTPGH